MPVQQDQLNIERDQTFLQDQAHIEGDETVERKDKIKKVYYVKVLVLLDSTVWQLFMSLVNPSLNITRMEHQAKKNMREYYSHIMNGVNHLYKGIDDPDIAIHVKIRTFIVFETVAHFPHNVSRVHIVNGSLATDANKYLADLGKMDLTSGLFKQFPEYDQVILFTRYSMYIGGVYTSQAAGISYFQKVCVPGSRVEIVHSNDYFRTMSTAAHELGHSLGARHDGAVNATACKAEDNFIMSSHVPAFDPNKAYSKNPWLFSKCSVEAFKTTLANKDCVTRKPIFIKAEVDEWNKVMFTLPGEKYTLSMQCQLIMGRGSVYCGALPGRICRFMYCTDPKTFKCMDIYFSAAPGTTCGINMWCQQGLCVKKGPRYESKISPSDSRWQ